MRRSSAIFDGCDWHQEKLRQITQHHILGCWYESDTHKKVGLIGTLYVAGGMKLRWMYSGNFAWGYGEVIWLVDAGLWNGPVSTNWDCKQLPCGWMIVSPARWLKDSVAGNYLDVSLGWAVCLSPSSLVNSAYSTSTDWHTTRCIGQVEIRER